MFSSLQPSLIHVCPPVWCSCSPSAQPVGGWLKTTCNDFSKSPTISRLGVYLANRCYLGILGQWREACPQSFDLSSYFFLFFLTVLNSCLYFCVVVTAASSSFLPRNKMFVSQNIFRVSSVDLFCPLNLEYPQASFPNTPITEHSFPKRSCSQREETKQNRVLPFFQEIIFY